MSDFAKKALKQSRPIKKPKLFAITQGTLYDVPMRLKKLSRDIEHGTYGRVTDSVVILRFIENGRLGVQGYHFGPSSIEIVQGMAQRIATRLMKYDQ
jgi:hypothetical protein